MRTGRQLALGNYLLGPRVPEIFLLNFYQQYEDVGQACSVSAALLPAWMDAVSLIP